MYFAPMYIAVVRPTVLVPTALDRAIPFIEWTIAIYYSYAVLLILPMFVCRDDGDVARLMYSIMLNSILAAIVFFAWPTAGVVQEPTSSGWVGLLWSGLLAVDRQANLFPSLHVANACSCAASLFRERREWRPIAVVWALAIAVSTLTTKQHLVVDLLGGVALAGFSNWLALVRERRPNPLSRAPNTEIV